MFTVIWPFCPFLAFVNNVLEVKGDTFRFFKNHRRPVPCNVDAGEPIGAWQQCINLQMFVASAVAPLCICFSTGQLEMWSVYLGLFPGSCRPPVGRLRPWPPCDPPRVVHDKS